MQLVSSVLQKCVVCRKLRGNNQQQKMADLPEDCIIPGPQFTNVGIDTYEPWTIITRQTRGGAVNSKRWAMIFTCLTTQSVHLEVVEELSSSSFINALRIFVSIRGPVKIIRSDCGTNFVGALDELKIDSIHVGDDSVKRFLMITGYSGSSVHRIRFTWEECGRE